MHKNTKITMKRLFSILMLLVAVGAWCEAEACTAALVLAKKSSEGAPTLWIPSLRDALSYTKDICLPLFLNKGNNKMKICVKELSLSAHLDRG